MTPFGARLRALRKSKGYTQGMLGARADLHQQAIQAIEIGRRHPTPYTITRLADALGVPIEDLAGPGIVAANPDDWLAFDAALAEAQAALDRLKAAALMLTRPTARRSP